MHKRRYSVNKWTLHVEEFGKIEKADIQVSLLLGNEVMCLYIEAERRKQMCKLEVKIV